MKSDSDTQLSVVDRRSRNRAKNVGRLRSSYVMGASKWSMAAGDVRWRSSFPNSSSLRSTTDPATVEQSTAAHLLTVCRSSSSVLTQ